MFVCGYCRFSEGDGNAKRRGAAAGPGVADGRELSKIAREWTGGRRWTKGPEGGRRSSHRVVTPSNSIVGLRTLGLAKGVEKLVNDEQPD